MFCALILLLYVKNSTYSKADDNPNTFPITLESETELLDFSILKPSEGATRDVL